MPRVRKPLDRNLFEKFRDFMVIDKSTFLKVSGSGAPATFDQATLASGGKEIYLSSVAHGLGKGRSNGLGKARNTKEGVTDLTRNNQLKTELGRGGLPPGGSIPSK